MAKIFTNFVFSWLVVLAIAIGFAAAEKSDFYYTLLPNEDICFEEIMNKDLGVHVNILCESRMCAFRMFDSENKQLYYKERDPEFDFSFTTIMPGAFKFWFVNLGRTYSKVDIKIRSGVDARNYENLVTQKKLKPIELSAKKIEDMASEIKKTMTQSLKAERELKRQVNKSSSTVTTSGFISIGIMIVATLISSFVLKTYFNKKKKM